MSQSTDRLKEAIRSILAVPRALAARFAGGDGTPIAAAGRRLMPRVAACAALGGAAYLLWTHPVLQTVPRGEFVVRSNNYTGTQQRFRDGSLLVLPGVHQVRRFPLNDQVYRPVQASKATGESPFQSVEGLSIGVDLSIRYAVDPERITALSATLPDNLGVDVVRPVVEGVAYKLLARYTVREIFSSKRAEIQTAIENELRPKLAADGLVLRAVDIGKVDLPSDYRNGMDRLLAEELASEQMRYTLELKDKQVKETALVAEADKVRREKAAEASAREQIIAAQAQEEAMKHVLPFKQKQVEQRQLEAEAEKVARIRSAEGAAQARLIEAAGEAQSREKLADAEVYRLEAVGKSSAAQMAREGELLTRNPLLIQKALADKLSDKIQVIIAPPPADGGFIGGNLLGAARTVATAHQDATAHEDAE